jgi:hypothetical protein
VQIWLLLSHDYLHLYVKHTANLLTSVTSALAVAARVDLASLALPIDLLARDNRPAYSALPQFIHF